MPPTIYLSAAIFYLFQHRPNWSKTAAVGKTLVSSKMIDYVTAKLGRKLCEVPVGFKWSVPGLTDGSLGFVGEESAGATFLRRDGSVLDNGIRMNWRRCCWLCAEKDDGALGPGILVRFTSNLPAHLVLRPMIGWKRPPRPRRRNYCPSFSP